MVLRDWGSVQSLKVLLLKAACFNPTALVGLIKSLYLLPASLRLS